jgi:hypothetical protein
MSIQGRLMAAIDAWRLYGSTADITATFLAERYQTLGLFYRGTWSADPRRQPFGGDVYRNARQVVSHTNAIVDCYEQLAYQGVIPTYGKALPEDVLLAIPIEPETGKGDAADEALSRAFYTVFDIGRWSRLCRIVPRMAAVYGDVLVQLKDDYQRGTVTPQVVPGWKVPLNGLELDDADNVKAVAIEYMVTIAESHAFGRDVKGETYRYRKEMTSREIRYYKDDKPWTDMSPDGHGDAVQPNPYGFVPAAWFRHQISDDTDRGVGAYERTLLQAMEANSLLSAAIDHQRKHLGAPIGVVGSAAVKPGRTLRMPGGVNLSATTTNEELEEARRSAAEDMNLLPMHGSAGNDPKFLTVPVEFGKALELFATLDESMVGENPESKYAQLMAEVAQVTGPGARARLAPIAAKVRGAQSNHDPRMTALAQMTVSIMGFRLNAGLIDADLVRARPDRYDAFKPYDLTSYGKGDLDASIAPRDPFPESKLEKAQWVQIVDGLGAWGKKEMGVSEEDIAAQAALDAQARADQLAAFSVAGAGSPPANDGTAAAPASGAVVP